MARHCWEPQTHNPNQPVPSRRRVIPADSASVSIIGTNLAQSLAGVSQAEKLEARDKRPKEPKAANRRARKDEYDQVTVETESADALRPLASNDQEEAREDRQEHPQYDPSGAKPGDTPPPKLDIEG